MCFMTVQGLYAMASCKTSHQIMKTTPSNGVYKLENFIKHFYVSCFISTLVIAEVSISVYMLGFSKHSGLEVGLAILKQRYIM